MFGSTYMTNWLNTVCIILAGLCLFLALKVKDVNEGKIEALHEANLKHLSEIAQLEYRFKSQQDTTTYYLNLLDSLDQIDEKVYTPSVISFDDVRNIGNKQHVQDSLLRELFVTLGHFTD